jgi:hypothetical protein
MSKRYETGSAYLLSIILSASTIGGMKRTWCLCVEISDKVYHDVCAIDDDLARTAHPKQRGIAAVRGAS